MGQTSSGSVSFGPSSHGLDVRLRWDKRHQGPLALAPRLIGSVSFGPFVLMGLMGLNGLKFRQSEPAEPASSVRLSEPAKPVSSVPSPLRPAAALRTETYLDKNTHQDMLGKARLGYANAAARSAGMRVA